MRRLTLPNERLYNHRRSVRLLALAGVLLLLGCSEESHESPLEPEVSILAGEWDYSFVATSPVECSVVIVPVGCSGGGVLQFTQSGTSLQGTYTLRGACQTCDYAADYGGSGNVKDLDVSESEVSFSIANFQFVAPLPDHAEDQIAGDISGTMGLDPDPSGSWRMTKKN